MAFIGVRISWLMLARNALLAWLASSARSARRASSLFSADSCSSAYFSSVMSETTMLKPRTSPPSTCGT